MKNDIIISLGTLALDADDATKNAYIKNAVKQIAEAVGWAADDDTLYSPSGNEKLGVYTEVSGSDVCIAFRAGTRADAISGWDTWTWSVAYITQWGCKGIQAGGCFVIITKSVSGSAFAVAFSKSSTARQKQLLICQNSDGKGWIENLDGTNHIRSLYEGQRIETIVPNGLMAYRISDIVLNNAKVPCFINVPDVMRSSAFPDVYRFVGVAGTDSADGHTFYANGAYYKSIGRYFLIRTV